MQAISLGSAAGLAMIDLYYAGQGRISKVYLLDAVAQIGLLVALLRESRHSHQRDSKQPAV